MYNKKYYDKLDKTMATTWKNFGWTALNTILATIWYIAVQPVRLCEYVYSEYQNHKQEEYERNERFENLKRSGHI